MNIKTDSRKVNSNDIFVAIKGMNVDGHDYIEEAIKKGATKIVAQRGEYSVETVIVPDTQKYLEEYLINNYKAIIESITFLAVTGTNGKTTTAYLTYQMLNNLGYKCAYIGTIGFYINENLVKELENTAPEITDMYALIIEAYEQDCSHIVLEASSHALVQNRLSGIRFNVAAFTNLTQDHLDYHKNMEEYLHAKLNILSYLKNEGVFITNVDDIYGDKFSGPNTKSIGFANSDYMILDFINLNHGTKITFKCENNNHIAETNLLSKFNVYNYITALALVHELGISINDIINVTKNIYPPKGRCEIIPIGTSKAVIDYAHTPDAVEKIITAFNEIKKGEVITIVGCGGDRDPVKRPMMGRIATDLSDFVIFTNDNPRTEDDTVIMQGILSGVEKDNYIVEYNRRTAIKEGIDMLRDNDILLILGKGHENYQIIGKNKIHFDDAEEVKKYLKKA